MSARIPAEVFPPGEFLKEELDARGWTQQELADIMERPPRVISEIIAAKRAITPETAQGLGDAFGTGAEYWMNLESQYALSKVRSSSDAVQRRAALHAQYPVREMIKRGWLPQTTSVDVLEQQVCRFFSIQAANEVPRFLHAAKKTAYDQAPSLLQLAWLFRTRQLAEAQLIPKYSEKKLREMLSRLRALMTAPEEARHVSKLLAECGVRLVLVEALPGSRIDGACYWLDANRPVIAMSLRFDRIDNFWFVLRHEIEHVLRRDGAEGSFILDQDIEDEDDEQDQPLQEKAANDAAAEFVVPRRELTDFCARVEPYFSEVKVCGFAQRLGVHPGIVVGQLQRRLKRHDFLRKHQVKVRSFVLSAGDADGWDVLSRHFGRPT